MSASRFDTEYFIKAVVRPGGVRDPRNTSLTTAIVATVNQCEEKALRLTSGSQPAPAADNRRLLAVLAWSYARELYSSAEIHSRLRRGGAAGLWQGEVPEIADIGRFRTENRRALQSCLQVALRLMAAQKVAEGFVTRIDESHIAAEAGRRITMAGFIDSMESVDKLAA
jgi:hypothetical protein